MNIPRGRSSFPAILVELHFGILVFVERGKLEDPEWTLGARTRTNNKLNPQATLNTGIEPRPRGEGKSPYHYFLRFSLTLLVHYGLKGFD